MKIDGRRGKGQCKQKHKSQKLLEEMDEIQEDKLKSGVIPRKKENIAEKKTKNTLHEPL
jgi:hypothetical protein